MLAAEAIRILQALGAGCDPETGELLPESAQLQSPSVLRAIFTAIRALESADSGEVASVGVYGTALAELGVRITGGPPRFRTEGWFSVGSTNADCPTCGHVLHGFRRPYVSSGRTYHYWALVCVPCKSAMDPSALNDANRQTLYASSEQRPGPRVERAVESVELVHEAVAKDAGWMSHAVGFEADRHEDLVEATMPCPDCGRDLYGMKRGRSDHQYIRYYCPACREGWDENTLEDARREADLETLRNSKTADPNGTTGGIPNSDGYP